MVGLLLPVRGSSALEPMVMRAWPPLGPRVVVSPAVARQTAHPEVVARLGEVEAPAALRLGEQEGKVAAVAAVVMAAVMGAT